MAVNKITPENEDACKRVLDDIFDNFDFKRVKKTMDALDWKWYDPPRSNFNGNKSGKKLIAPTLDEIKETAAQLMWRCANTDVDVISSFGFRVEKDFTIPDDPWMRLTFEVTDWDVSANQLGD